MARRVGEAPLAAADGVFPSSLDQSAVVERAAPE